MPERGMGRVFRPTRECLRCKGEGCEHCSNTGRRQIETWWRGRVLARQVQPGTPPFMKGRLSATVNLMADTDSREP